MMDILSLIRSKKAEILLLTCSLIVCASILELSSAWVYSHHFNREFSYQYTQKRITDSLNTTSFSIEEDFEKNLKYGDKKFSILHPYMGYVLSEDFHSNDYGFYSDEMIIQKSSDKVIIGIFGGSLALFNFNNPEELKKELSKSPLFRDKDIKVVVLALVEYKQPQQLMALNYVSVMGGEFDYVINLDGFNEVVLTQAVNVPLGVHPIFPHAWNMRSRSTSSPDIMPQLYKIQEIKKDRLWFTEMASKTPFRHSTFFLTLWEILDQEKENELYSANNELKKILSDDNKKRQSRGPLFEYTDYDTLVSDSVDIWRRSSMMMSKICESKGMTYLHFLQPNQYVTGSKKYFTEYEEQKYIPDSPYAIAATRGYPVLLSQGKFLQQHINFYDLTMIFENETETVYYDSCCHVNRYGKSIITKTVAEKIIQQEALKRQSER
ncbi:MAG: hypothetical protein ABIH11_02860 [Candidatus Altiarchaeota archaeon]